MNRKRQSIYWNPEKHPDFDAWVSEQENLSAAVRALYMKSRSRQGLSGDALAAMAREVAPLVAPLVRQGDALAIGIPTPETPIGVQVDGPERESTSISDPDKTRANARKTANRFKTTA